MSCSRLNRAIAAMADSYPFHTGLLRAMRFEPDRSVRTMGVAIVGGAVRCFFDPRFVRKCSPAELRGVLAHEVAHVVLGHPTANASDFPDREARMLAEEVTANEFVHEDLPGCPPTLGDFPFLPPGESTAIRYRRLRQWADGGKDRPNAWLVAATRSLDDHDTWSRSDCSPVAGRFIVGTAVSSACRAVPGGLGGLPAGLRPYVEELTAAGCPGRVDWGSRLRRLVAASLETRAVFTRPPRRRPELVGLVPVQARTSARPRILAAVDTSASMDGRTLAAIGAELARLDRQGRVTVVECDDAIRGAYTYRPLVSAHGRGGTDFRPVFEPEFLRYHRPDVILYFTDGAGEAPPRPPAQPVVWCLTTGGRRPAPWGNVVRVSHA